MQKDKIQVHFYASSDDVDKFKRLYPSCLSNILKKAIRFCIEDRLFFDKIMFGNLEDFMEFKK